MLRPCFIIVLLVASAISVTSCSKPKWVDSALGKQVGTSRQEGQTYYSGTAGLSVYEKASVSSKVVGRLSQHEKVTRTRVEHGYAYIVAENGRVEGWVENSRLEWRVPTEKRPSKVPVSEAGTQAVVETDSPVLSTDSPKQPATVPAAISLPETTSPAAAENFVEPVPEVLSTPKKPVQSGDGSKVTPSIFDSF